MGKIKITYKQYGGKDSISKWIVSNFPEHQVYVEPFCGSCSVLFAKIPSFIEVINDIDEKIINMFKHIRKNPKELAALLWATPYSEDNWREEIEGDSLEASAMFMAQSVQYYCGNCNSSTWALDKSGVPHKPKNKVFSDWFLRILPAAARLKDVQLLNEDAIKVIERFKDNQGTLMYIDPPYFNHEKEYKYQVDYKKMVELLKNCKGKVIVSEYPEADSFFKGWRVVKKVTAGRARTGAHNRKAKIKTEVLYMNFEKPKPIYQSISFWE